MLCVRWADNKTKSRVCCKTTWNKTKQHGTKHLFLYIVAEHLYCRWKTFDYALLRLAEKKPAANSLKPAALYKNAAWGICEIVNVKRSRRMNAILIGTYRVGHRDLIS